MRSDNTDLRFGHELLSVLRWIHPASTKYSRPLQGWYLFWIFYYTSL